MPERSPSSSRRSSEVVPPSPDGMPSQLPARAAPIGFGERSPAFVAPTLDRPAYAIDTVAGRWILLAFLGRLDRPEARAALAELAAGAERLDPGHAIAFGFVHEAADLPAAREAMRIPALRFFQDPHRVLARLHGAATEAGEDRPVLILLDPQMRGVTNAPVNAAAALLEHVARLPPPPHHAGGPAPPPILLVPRLFEPELCGALIAAFEADGGEPSGFMREVDGRTRLEHDPRHKRRRDMVLRDGELAAAVRQRLRTRLVPEMLRAFQFHATRIERMLVACYDAADQGGFAPHRDNTTSGTAHRRFACTVNLNPAEYEGGDLRFPEYSAASFRAPQGGAIVFSCSLLHEALPVTRGRRYAFLPFFYDEAAAEIRRANNARLAPDVAPYRG
jgi:predicted 2-oxoglutarate/Fe(II)-dependent dioxygenase YbiX